MRIGTGFAPHINCRPHEFLGVVELESAGHDLEWVPNSLRQFEVEMSSLNDLIYSRHFFTFLFCALDLRFWQNDNMETR